MNNITHDHVKTYIKKQLDEYFQDGGLYSYWDLFGGYPREQYKTFLNFLYGNFKQQDILLDSLYSKYINYIKKRKKDNPLKLEDFIVCLLNNGFCITTFYDENNEPHKVVNFLWNEIWAFPKNICCDITEVNKLNLTDIL